jgi:hypothetical protein
LLNGAVSPILQIFFFFFFFGRLLAAVAREIAQEQRTMQKDLHSYIQHLKQPPTLAFEVKKNFSCCL